MLVDEQLDAETDEPDNDRSSGRAVVALVALLVVLFLVRTFVAEPVRVRSDSMSPTIESGSVVLIDKVTYLTREPSRGDVIVTHDPRSGESIVKRIVAIGGDSIGIEDGSLVRNGAVVVERNVDNDQMDGYYFGPDIVPPGTVFVLGDNRSDSVDSRAFGPIEIDDIDGRIAGTMWPLG